MRTDARIQRRLLFFLVSLTLLALTTTACTTRPPSPRSSYQADVTLHLIDADGQERIIGRYIEFFRRGKRRQETRLDGRVTVVIDRPDLGVSWKLNPEASTFVEYPLNDMSAELTVIPNPFGPRINVEYEHLGSETINEMPARKYAVKGKIVRGTAWLTRSGVPLRFEGEFGLRSPGTQIRAEYGVILRGKIGLDRFEIPSTYAGYADRTRKSSDSELTDAQLRQLQEEQSAIQSVPGGVILSH